MKKDIIRAAVLAVVASVCWLVSYHAGLEAYNGATNVAFYALTCAAFWLAAGVTTCGSFFVMWTAFGLDATD